MHLFPRQQSYREHHFSPSITQSILLCMSFSLSDRIIRLLCHVSDSSLSTLGLFRAGQLAVLPLHWWNCKKRRLQSLSVRQRVGFKAPVIYISLIFITSDYLLSFMDIFYSICLNAWMSFLFFSYFIMFFKFYSLVLMLFYFPFYFFICIYRILFFSYYNVISIYFLTFLLFLLLIFLHFYWCWMLKLFLIPL